VGAYIWKKGGDIIGDRGQICLTLEEDIGKSNTDEDIYLI
jgi:hypothetical protein